MSVSATYVSATVLCSLAILILVYDACKSWGNKTFKLVTQFLYLSGVACYLITMITTLISETVYKEYLWLRSPLFSINSTAIVLNLLEILKLFYVTSVYLSVKRILKAQLILAFTCVLAQSAAIVVYLKLGVIPGNLIVWAYSFINGSIMSMVAVILTVLIINFCREIPASTEWKDKIGAKIRLIHKVLSICLINLGITVIFVFMESLVPSPEGYFITYLFASLFCMSTSLLSCAINQLGIQLVELTKLGIEAGKGERRIGSVLKSGYVMFKDYIKTSKKGYDRTDSQLKTTNASESLGIGPSNQFEATIELR